jgi:hypothetical protein
MRRLVAIVAISALVASGCGNPRQDSDKRPGEARALNASNNISANSVFGPVEIRSVPDLCAGHVRLANGTATVNDACFTGDTNVVLCTDTTSPSAVQCSASNGKLMLAGAGTDFISYARVR